MWVGVRSFELMDMLFTRDVLGNNLWPRRKREVDGSGHVLACLCVLLYCTLCMMGAYNLIAVQFLGEYKR